MIWNLVRGLLGALLLTVVIQIAMLRFGPLGDLPGFLPIWLVSTLVIEGFVVWQYWRSGRPGYKPGIPGLRWYFRLVEATRPARWRRDEEPEPAPTPQQIHRAQRKTPAAARKRRR